MNYDRRTDKKRAIKLEECNREKGRELYDIVDWLKETIRATGNG